MAVPFNSIAQGLTFLGNVVNDIFSYINPFSDNFILKDVLSFLGNIISYINPFDTENFLGYKIVYLIRDILVELFVPTENPFEELKTTFENKFGFIFQIRDLVFQLFNFPSSVDSEDDVPPSFTITYYGVTVEIIDFSVFERFRNFFHGIIIAICWVSFISRLYKRIPGIINGFYVEESGL